MMLLLMLASVLLLSPPLQPAAVARQMHAVPLDVHKFKVLGEEYDPENPHQQAPTYYHTVDDGQQSFVRGIYLPPQSTVTLFQDVPDELHQGVRRMQWRWRAQVLPRHGNECASGLGDSAAAVYITWKRGLRWYSLKFIWSADAPVGATCNRIRNPFVASDSIVLRSGRATNGWEAEVVDPEELSGPHFARDAPALKGTGFMREGAETATVRVRDYDRWVH